MVQIIFNTLAILFFYRDSDVIINKAGLLTVQSKILFELVVLLMSVKA